MKFDFDDILLTPETLSVVNSRKDVNPFDEFGMLPIMTAPMDTVVDENNAKFFLQNKINIVLPRGFNLLEYSSTKNFFYSYGLTDFEELFLNDNPPANKVHYALIDIANGHMFKLFNIAKKAKEKHGDNLILMVGNIANPATYYKLAEIGIDYVRCGIGGGQGCLTSVQTGVGYPMGSLINECFAIKSSKGFKTKIVADGGFKKFSDINKALALGADYVMLGSLLNKTLESCGETYEANPHYNAWGAPGKTVDPHDQMILSKFKSGTKYFKKYRGMSTKEVQKEWGKVDLTTSEGISKYHEVEYTIEGFVKNLEDYLRSAMSYTGSLDLKEFKETSFELITSASFQRFNK
jgi:IMP dehydrogenase/GMP reductase